MLDGVLDGGYGMLRNASEVAYMKTLTDDEQKARIKKLWLEDPEAYYEWKEDCIESGYLPDLFGTSDNPITIDESKL
ncbi:hypothetical protein [uncultured Methanobrevibacter sp.]|uniref:hypothetical protein n=1 Tax=uncultured Methanobrevibacter sp. TaxID=253161 RepID=UPI002624DAD3|nr:hypothetical protein [uncultured Methanobrevibacter sp.]